MKREVSPMQRATLRGIERGDPWHSFDGRTLNSLRHNGLLDGCTITSAGRAAIADTLAVPAPLEIPLQRSTAPVTTTEREASETNWNMLEVCCEALESAVAAEVIESARGRLFLRVGTRAWYLEFCPWCGEKRA